MDSQRHMALVDPDDGARSSRNSCVSAQGVRGFEAVLVDEEEGHAEASATVETRSWRVVWSTAAVLLVTGSVAVAAVLSGRPGAAPGRSAEDVNFDRHPGYDCWSGFGGSPLESAGPPSAMPLADCQRTCREQEGCRGFVFPAGVPVGICVLHQSIELTHCLKSPAMEVWMLSGVAVNMGDAEAAHTMTDAEMKTSDVAWFHRALRIETLPGYRCEMGSRREERHESLDLCKRACRNDDACGGVSYSFPARRCHLHVKLAIDDCQLHADWDAWLKPALAAWSPPTPAPTAPPMPAPVLPRAPPPMPVPEVVPVAPPAPRIPDASEVDLPDVEVVATIATTVSTTTVSTTTVSTTTVSTTWMSAEAWKEYKRKYEEDVGVAKELGYFQMIGHDCWSPNASSPIAGWEVPFMSAAACGRACNSQDQCEGFIYGHSVRNGTCWLRRDTALPLCKRHPLQVPEYDYFLKLSPAEEVAPATAPVNEFYMYRAAAADTLSQYPLGQVNMGNMDGVIWYLMNEIVTNYTQGPRCPRRFDISRIHRFKIKTRATREMEAVNMSWGARYAYDQGMCMGRCFQDNMCTGAADCATQYDKYGFVPGCNNFESDYPFPVDANSAPSGVWYSLPLEGRCDGEPTGAKDCTWSYEYAGHITLASLEDLAPGDDNCCDGRCSDFWRDQWDPLVTSWRVDTAMWMFQSKYPNSTKALRAPTCDFDREKWYAEDPWTRQDPWR